MMDMFKNFGLNFQISLLFLFIFAIFLFCLLYYSLDLQIKSKHNPTENEEKIYEEVALASTSELCEKYVLDIYRKGGSVADAAVVALSIQGLTSPQSLGVGGGFLLLHYDKKNANVSVLNAREYSPIGTKIDMYRKCSNSIANTPLYGGLSSAIPGEFYGYWELHEKFGKLPWKMLFEPAIELCRDGIPVTKITEQMLMKMRRFIMASPSLREMLCDPETEDVYKFGDLMKRPVLAKTFEIISEYGAEALYDGILTENFVKDIQDNGGIFTLEDMYNYSAKWTTPLSLDLTKSLQIYTTPSPGSGQEFLSILDVIFSFEISDKPGVNWFRIVEAWKHAFGHRKHMEGPTVLEDLKTETYDPFIAKTIVEIIKNTKKTSYDVRHYCSDFEKLKSEGGTCHISLYGPDGDAISVTSSVNYAFGGRYLSKSTGILMNNHMMDFAIPNYMNEFYVTNQLSPQKQPVSCMVPSIIINKKTKNVKMIVGAAGGFKILTAASQLIIETLLYRIPQEYAVCHRRLHHQLIPMVLFYEEDFPENIVEELEKYGHFIERTVPGTSVSIITISEDGIRATGDSRRNGTSCGY